MFILLFVVLLTAFFLGNNLPIARLITPVGPLGETF